MGAGVAVILSTMVFAAVLLIAGFSYCIRNVRVIAAIILTLSAAVCWWARHYLIVLSDRGELPADLQWHRVYMICILTLIPCSLIVGSILGLVRQQRDYQARYETGPTPH